MRRQFRMICRFAKVDEWAMRVSRWHPPSLYLNANRLPGRPSHRWDDLLNMFVRDNLNYVFWQYAINDAFVNFPDQENIFVSYVQNIY